ncbi:MAG: S1/P1 nuclease [Parachlamydiales bacterium]|nr:S1/P1 nuclease [Parachlamydiales bacterium]
MLKKTIFILFLTFTLNLHSWWDSSHIVIAKIAKENMSQNAKEKCDNLINFLSEYYPNTSTFETSAVWADQMMNKGISFGIKHGFAKIYDPNNEGDENAKTKYAIELESSNGTKSLNEIIKALKSPKTNKLEKALMLRFLIHIVGDMHQPLHCINYYSKEFKHGDFFGCRFYLDYSLNQKNSLHALWDSALLRDDLWLKLPLNKEGEDYLNNFKSEVTIKFPKSSFLEDEIENMDFDTWAQESFLIGKNHAYENIHPGDRPSDAYLIENRNIAYRQIALSGYRLAYILNDIFKESF